jgi:hypothetical protein
MQISEKKKPEQSFEIQMSNCSTKEEQITET